MLTAGASKFCPTVRLCALFAQGAGRARQACSHSRLACSCPCAPLRSECEDWEPASGAKHAQYTLHICDAASLQPVVQPIPCVHGPLLWLPCGMRLHYVAGRGGDTLMEVRLPHPSNKATAAAAAAPPLAQPEAVVRSPERFVLAFRQLPLATTREVGVAGPRLRGAGASSSGNSRGSHGAHSPPCRVPLLEAFDSNRRARRAWALVPCGPPPAPLPPHALPPSPPPLSHHTSGVHCAPTAPEVPPAPSTHVWQPLIPSPRLGAAHVLLPCPTRQGLVMWAWDAWQPGGSLEYCSLEGLGPGRPHSTPPAAAAPPMLELPPSPAAQLLQQQQQQQQRRRQRQQGQEPCNPTHAPAALTTPLLPHRPGWHIWDVQLLPAAALPCAQHLLFPTSSLALVSLQHSHSHSQRHSHRRQRCRPGVPGGGATLDGGGAQAGEEADRGAAGTGAATGGVEATSLARKVAAAARAAAPAEVQHLRFELHALPAAHAMCEQHHQHHHHHQQQQQQQWAAQSPAAATMELLAAAEVRVPLPFAHFRSPALLPHAAAGEVPNTCLWALPLGMDFPPICP